MGNRVEVPQKLGIEFPYDSATPLLYLKILKTLICKGVFTPCSLQHYSQSGIHMEITDAPCDGWLDKDVVRVYNGVLTTQPQEKMKYHHL